MNERYLFRGKRIDTGQWICGGLYEWGEGWNIVGKDIWDKDNETASLIPVIPATIGQCTGLRDKNGTLIFEGDIMSYGSYDTSKGVVKWLECAWRLITKWDEFDKDRDLLIDCVPEFFGEIHGNVHDNPEILEGGAEA